MGDPRFLLRHGQGLDSSGGPPQAAPARARPQLLVVEDETATALAGALRRLGYEVAASVPTAEEAVAAARRLRPDVALLDVQRWGAAQGFAAAEAIRKEADVPVIYLATAADEGALKGAASARPFGYLLAPCEDQELRAAIEAALRQRAVAREREAEEALRHRERLLQDVLDHTQALVYLKDARGRYTLVNRRFEETFGVAQAALRGRQDREVLPERLRDALWKGDERVLRQGRPMRAETIIRHADGPHAYLTHRFPLFDAAGRTEGVCGILTDVSELKRSEEALRRSEAMYRMIAESTTDIIALSVAKDGMVRYVSPACERLLGYSPEELTDRPGQDLIHPEDIAKLGANPVEAHRARGSPPVAFRVRKRDGAYVWVEANIETLPEQNPGEGPLLLSITRDITERKRVEDQMRSLNDDLEQRIVARTRQLELANEELEAIMRTVSHDLRAPIRGITMLAEALRDDYPREFPPEAGRLIERIHGESERLAKLVGELMSFTRAGRADLRLASVDLSALAREILTGLQRAEPARQVEVDVAPGLVAQGDEELLRLVLENLLGNAWKFTSRKEVARIAFGATTGPDGRTAYFVRDDGAGFDVATAGRLFEPFQRLHSAKEFPGTGLGLSSVRRIVERHGGRAWAEGRVGEGATFFFTLGREDAAGVRR